MSPRVEAMHVADVSMAFCKLCKLLLRKTSATALPPTLGLWNPLDVAGFVWDNTGYCGGGVAFSAIRKFVFSCRKKTLI